MPNGLTPQEREAILARLGRAFEEPAAEALLDLFDQLVLRRAEMVTRQDIQQLESRFWEGQQALEQALARLAEAQARTEERVGRVEEALARLAEAQARSEERLGRLEEAQSRTDASVKELAEAQTRTEASMKALAEAQARTDKALQRLSRQVGGLSETVGGDIEDIAYIVLYDVLKREFGWEVGVLKRTWQRWGRIEEINVFGQARDPAQPERTIWIVGEAKHNLTVGEVNRFAKQVARARRHLEGDVFPVCFCYRARPEVRDRLRDLDIRLVFSYGRMA